jgi:hypothetical protein
MSVFFIELRASRNSKMPGPIDCWSRVRALLSGAAEDERAIDGSEAGASTLGAEALSLSFSLALAARMRVLKTAGLESSRTT